MAGEVRQEYKKGENRVDEEGRPWMNAAPVQVTLYLIINENNSLQ